MASAGTPRTRDRPLHRREHPHRRLCSPSTAWDAGEPRCPFSMVAVAQTPGEAAGSFLRVGSEIGHRIRHARCTRPDLVTPSRSDGHLRDRAAAFPRQLYATAAMRSDHARPRPGLLSRSAGRSSPLCDARGTQRASRGRGPMAERRGSVGTTTRGTAWRARATAGPGSSGAARRASGAETDALSRHALALSGPPLPGRGPVPILFPPGGASLEWLPWIWLCRAVYDSAPDRIRTCDLRFRRPTLYPAELRALGDERLAAPDGPTRTAHSLDFKRG